MRKIIKFSMILASLGFGLLTIYYAKRRRNDRIENHILKEIKSKYRGFPIQGSWIQKHNGCYSGGVTVLINNEKHNYHFTADCNGRPVIMN